jgi:hypothetical protein
MRFNGRITVYGEHLMCGDAFGLITPSLLYLADGDDNSASTHPDYDPKLDSVRAMLTRDGYPTTPVIRGNLPFGYGFASSSALALLHIGTGVSENVLRIVDRTDQAIHGFIPSGVDSGFHVRKRAGLYRSGEWLDSPELSLEWSCALFPKERRLTLPQAREIIRARRAGLVPIARALTQGLLESGYLSHDALLDYAWELFRTGAYTAEAARIIDLALRQGVVAKGIGGVYDKAILFLRCEECRTPPEWFADLKDTVSAMAGARWLESV